jgi:hypothetical protein
MTEESWLTEKRLNRILAVVFLVVGILATLNTFRLHEYIRETLPRDERQEECNTETIKVLTQWLEIRKKRDSAMDVRDDAAITVLDQLTLGGKPNPEELKAWRDAVIRDHQVRIAADAASSPLPDCT